MNPSSVGATCDSSSGWRFSEQRDHLHQLRIARRDVSFEHRGRAERQQTDQRPHFQAHRLAVREPQQIVEEPVLLVPHLVVVLADAVHRVRDPHEVLDELEGDLLVHRVVLGRGSGPSPACTGSRTPSRPCRPPARASPPVGSSALRSKTPMLSRPRNPPAKTLRPAGSLRFTHQLKLSISPWNERSRNRMSARPSVRSILNKNSVAQACTGGFTSLKFHS